MGGGLIQLVAHGIEDIFLINEPEITFFKVVYRRHTNFSFEPVPQFFSSEPSFGNKSSCVLARAGDLAGMATLVLSLPKIDKYISSTNTYEFQWVRRVAFALINYIEIEIGGQTIDRHYGEWLNLWYELGKMNKKTDGYDKLIGNVSTLSSMTESKDKYTLHIPLQFWFCRHTGLALPLVNLYYNEVKINVNFNTADHCYILHPASYIKVDDDIVPFTKGEYIEQTLNGTTVVGEFVYFDAHSKKAYFTRLSSNKFQGVATSDPNASSYIITGKTTNYTIAPIADEAVNRIPRDWVKTINISDCFLLIDYYYLDRDERIKFAENTHEYLIEQVQHINDTTISSMFNQTVKLGYDHPCKEVIWVTQFEQARKNKQWFNYTNSFKYSSTDSDYEGTNIINEGTVIMGGHERESFRPSWFFDTVQPWEYHHYSVSKGINLYSHALMPTNHQPSGSANYGATSDVELKCSFHRTTETIRFASYVTTMNILRISNGFCGLVFAR
jgi:hypothetical protein